MGKKTCVVRGCPTKGGEGKCMFKFPNTINRAQTWLKACNREDLLNKSLQHMKICELHFEEKYMTKGLTARKNLFEGAVPTIFPWLKRQHDENTVDVALIPQKKICTLASSDETTLLSQEPRIETDKVYQELEIATCSTYSPRAMTPPLLSPSATTQTPMKLSFNSPRKNKLRLKVRTLRNNIRTLRRKKETKKSSNKLQEFNALCYQASLNYLLD